MGTSRAETADDAYSDAGCWYLPSDAKVSITAEDSKHDTGYVEGMVVRGSAANNLGALHLGGAPDVVRPSGPQAVPQTSLGEFMGGSILPGITAIGF